MTTDEERSVSECASSAEVPEMASRSAVEKKFRRQLDDAPTAEARALPTSRAVRMAWVKGDDD